MYQRLIRTEVGDLVLEITTIHRRMVPEVNCIGTLICETREPMWSEEVWQESLAMYPGMERPYEAVTYILGFDGNKHRWTNARFIGVSRDIEDLF